MSKIGRQLIELPKGVKCELKNNIFNVSGPKGSLALNIPINVEIEERDNNIYVSSKNNVLWGTFRALISNLIIGVNSGFEKKLEVKGIGYKAKVEVANLFLEVGFSHNVTVKIPEDLKVEVKDNIITVSGIDKVRVGQFAANIKKIRPTEPYKGKGIRYEGEYVKIKPGKKAGVSA
ncbi:MAG: 50S ribosomal protein L6 [Parcubacteria group bacterium GW2011_GWA2_31_28]|nr:MAG: 50S ribosomal protein L6 [Parcubacteria group bacterium GW2011_GWA2_31_28]